MADQPTGGRDTPPSDLTLVAAGYDPRTEFEDYTVRHQGKTVGRIYRAPTTNPAGREWFWSVLIIPQPADCYGYARSRDDAVKAFRAAWDAQPPGKKKSL